MKETLLLPEEEAPKKPFWRAWKWVGLICFAVVLLFKSWLPGLVIFLGWVYGIVVIANLLFSLFRFLKDHFFWRVRNRILGSFIFIGFIPLCLLLGTGFVSGYLLVGQLAANYLETSIHSIIEELAFIGDEVAARVTPNSPVKPEAAISRVIARYRTKFPILAASLSHRRSDGTFETTWKYDPGLVLPVGDTVPAEKWIGSDGRYDGLLRQGHKALLTSLKPLPATEGYFLNLTAPLDHNVEERLQKEKSIFTVFVGVGKTKVKVSDAGYEVTMGEGDRKRTPERGGERVEEDAEEGARSLALRRQNDKRRMVSWGTPLRGKEFDTGRDDTSAVAILHVPVETLFRIYFSGSYNQGKALLIVIGILAGLFVFVELISVIIGITISRRITKSINDMYQGTLALQKGDLQYKIPVRKKDQLGLLAHSFNQMSGAISRLMEEVTEKKRLEQELEIAREVQATLFPKQLPKPRGMAVFGGCEPARTVSGDYYDFIVEDEARLHIVIGDISGKGISAALLMANLQAAMRNQLMAARPGSDEEFGNRLVDALARLNEQIYANSPSEKYVTLFSSRYDAERQQLFYCNAGHLPPILLYNEEVRRLDVGGTVLGLFPKVSYQAGLVQLAPGTIMVIFTDGITEAVNGADEEFGEERLMVALKECRARSPEAIYQHVTGQVREWQGTQKQHDDITLIVAKVD